MNNLLNCKIYEMASYNLCDSLTEIIESLSEELETEPETILFKNIDCIEDDEKYLFIGRKFNTIVFYKSEGRCEYNKNRILFYRKKYYCKMSKQIFYQRKLLKIDEGYILNKHVFLTKPHHRFSLKKVQYVSFLISDIQVAFISAIQVAFVFDIEDLRKKYSDALNNLLCHLPIELVKDIATKMGATKPFLCSSGDIYKPSDFPFDFVSKYSSVMCDIKHLSRMQVDKLFEIGVVKIAIATDDNYNSYNLLTDEAFDYQFPTANGFVDNKIKIIFKTKENMHSYIKQIINHRL